MKNFEKVDRDLLFGYGYVFSNLSNLGRQESKEQDRIVLETLDKQTFMLVDKSFPRVSCSSLFP